MTIYILDDSGPAPHPDDLEELFALDPRVTVHEGETKEQAVQRYWDARNAIRQRRRAIEAAKIRAQEQKATKARQTRKRRQ